MEDERDLYLKSPPPRRVEGGLKARSDEGEFGRNWWAKRWLSSLERLMDSARLARGRKYASMGQVISFEEKKKGIKALVQGTRRKPYVINIMLAHFTDDQWEKVLDHLSNQAIFTAQLLAGEMPRNIEEAFSSVGASLFPNAKADLITNCTCPDWANPCKHVSAVYYILGDRFDEDPFLIFRLRGKSEKEILQGLRLRRGGEPSRPIEEPSGDDFYMPLDDDEVTYWMAENNLLDFQINIMPPTLHLPILQRLGEPDFLGKISIQEELKPVYDAVSQVSLSLAFRDIGPEPSNGSAEPENG